MTLKFHEFKRRDWMTNDRGYPMNFVEYCYGESWIKKTIV
jgi:hypothetical protein